MGGWGGGRVVYQQVSNFHPLSSVAQWSDAQKARPVVIRRMLLFSQKTLYLLGRMRLAERVRIEHTSTRKRADNGFEDREGHQAPITLRNRPD